MLDRLRPPPVLIGHSHAKAIFEAARTAGVRLLGYNFWTAPQPALNPDRSAFHPEIRETLSRGPVFSVVGGAAHNVFGMVQHPAPYDFVLPAEPDLPIQPGAVLLPVDAVRGALLGVVQEYLDIMGLVRASASGAVYHFEPPPPLADDARVRVDVPWSFFPDLTHEVAPAALRYKLWRLHSEIVGGFCREAGIELIPVPSEAMDRAGYLKPVHYHDAMHVNESYGALVLKQMRRRL